MSISYFQYPHFDAGFFQEIHGHGVRITAGDDDLTDTRVNEHLSANDTGLIRDVHRTALDRDTVKGRLYDGVLLPVEPAA